MTITDRIFEQLRKIDMSQKEFSEKTGIAQSTISEWKKKGNNPTAEKIMPISKVLGVTPEWLLSGVDVKGERSNKIDFYIIDRKSDIGTIISIINQFDSDQMKRFIKYFVEFSEINIDANKKREVMAMDESFNLFGLTDIYRETDNSDDKCCSFEIAIGRGRFLLMLFLGSDDKDAKDNLYIYLRNTGVLMRKQKMYGSHRKGEFKVYLKDIDKKQIIEELNLGNGGNRKFDFNNFINEFNSAIPKTIPFNNKIESLRENRDIVGRVHPDFIDENEKTVLVGTKKLPDNKKPQDKTLRKLYLLRNDDPDEIKELISMLKDNNTTLVWTTPENAKGRDVNIRGLIR